MPSARSVLFAAEAEDDIQQILQYTLETWGDRQLREYAAGFDRVFDLLAEFPLLGRPRFEPHIYAHRMREHVIYYSFSAEQLMIRRILHKHRDPREEFFEPRIEG